MSSGRVGQAFVLTCFFTAGYGRHRKLGVGFRTAGYGRHRSQWVKRVPTFCLSISIHMYSLFFAIIKYSSLRASIVSYNALHSLELYFLKNRQQLTLLRGPQIQ